jgi:hypothetical protein
MMHDKADFLQQCLVFDSLPRSRIDYIASIAHTRYFDRGSVIQTCVPRPAHRRR